MTQAIGSRTDTRTRIVDEATALLAQHGPAGVTTRAVAEAAGVQAPAIYRLFGDKDGLLEAVAEHVLATFVSAKAKVVQAATARGVDPVEDLRDGWRTAIEFGLAHPFVHGLLSDRQVHSPAAQAGLRVLEGRVHRLAEAGRLRVSEPRAVGLIQAAGTGAVRTLVATPVEQRDTGLADALFEAVCREVLGGTATPAPDAPVAAAVTVRALAPTLEALSDGEKLLLAEWLDRVVEELQHRPGVHDVR